MKRHYFVHLESYSAWFEDHDDDVKVEKPPLVESVTRDEFLHACYVWGIDPDEDSSYQPKNAGPQSADLKRP